LAHGLDSFAHTSQLRQAEGPLIVRRSVRRVLSDQLPVFLDALLIITGHPAVIAARRKTFAVCHFVKMTERFLRVLVAVLQVAQIPRHGCNTLITEAKIRIQLNSLEKELSCLLQLVVG